MLEYRVISSNGFNIYKVRFDGEGENLKAYCTCPAGKRAKLFCKHISGLLNGDTSNIIEPSDKIEALSSVINNSPLMDKNKEYKQKREQNWFEINNIKINDVEGIYNYLKNIIGDEIIIEHNKELKNNYRLAIYKAEYYKNGNPKYIIKNRIIYMEYNSALTYFKIDSQFYKYFASAGKNFIEKIERIIEEKMYLKISNENFAFKAMFSDGYVTGPFVTKYNELELICQRAVVLLLLHISYNKLKNISIKKIDQIKMECDESSSDSYYVVPHKIIKTYYEDEYKNIIEKLLMNIEKQ